MRAAFVDWAMVSDRDGKLSLAPGAAVYVYDQGTTNLITDTIYAGASGGTTQANPLTAAADGEFAVYLDQPRMVTIKVTQAGYTDQSFDVAIVAPGVSYRGAWLTATAYREDQLVTNDGTTYIAISDHTSAAATEPGVGASWATVWEVFAEKGADGGGGHTIKEGATPFAQRTGLMFTAADFNLTDDAVGDETEVALAADVVRDADLAAYQALSGKDSASGYMGLDASGNGNSPPKLHNATRHTFVGASIYKSASQTIGTASEVDVTWDSEHYDTNSIHDNATNNARVTVPAGMGGKWRLSGTIIFSSNSSGRRYLALYKNGGLIRYPAQLPSAGAAPMNIPFSVDLLLAAGDYLVIKAYQDSGGDLDVVGGSNNSFIDFAFLGA